MNNEENNVNTTNTQPVDNNTNINAVPVEKSNSKVFNFSPLLKVLLIILLVSGAFYFFLTYSSFLKDRIGTKENDIVTTTKKKEPTTLEEYLEYIEVSEFNSSLQILNGTYKEVDTEYLDRCYGDGDKVSFEKNGIKYEYTCDVDEFGFYDGSKYVTVEAKINDTYTYKITNYNVNEYDYKVAYLINDYFFIYTANAIDSISSIGYVDKDLNEKRIILLSKVNDSYISPYISDGYLYCVVYDDGNSERNAKDYVFNIMKYDLTDFKLVEKLGSFTYEIS